ncbi:hypothetical protein K488DRAFT_85479 [Vararia minispora EC-137]|uniref:Uncharacterized protein n=1 Tax=Vararia minispora EC-137 TaxID=1314806 RepID=A0ACB8QLU4_9AGAM|nr:hypothetical protein K488DRAFT_85479 [Vararia minispora EC-137]
MPTVVAPQPIRLASAPVIVDPDSHAPLSPHVGRQDEDDPFICRTSTPLKPTISRQFLLPPPRISTKRPKLISKSPTPCSSIKNSSLLHAPRSPRRRRHASHSRAAYGFPPRNPSAFDSLSWISALDSAEFIDPWNIADLSQLPVDDRSRWDALGPIRRRKTSVPRSDALRSPVLEASARPPQLAPLATPARDVIHTPPPRFSSASHVQFHNLMPVWSPRATA